MGNQIKENFYNFFLYFSALFFSLKLSRNKTWPQLIWLEVKFSCNSYDIEKLQTADLVWWFQTFIHVMDLLKVVLKNISCFIGVLSCLYFWNLATFHKIHFHVSERYFLCLYIYYSIHCQTKVYGIQYSGTVLMEYYNQNTNTSLFKYLTLLSCFNIFFSLLTSLPLFLLVSCIPLTFMLFWDKLNGGKWYRTCQNVPRYLWRPELSKLS